jgi:glycosyltransferase involved in cell wall biosynthesis
MLNFIVRLMHRRGYEPVIAHYEPYMVTPRLSVPSFALLRRTPGFQNRRAHGCESHAIGAWLPELEFTHYTATRHWKSLIEGCSAYVSVSGNALAATPYYQTGKPFLSWVATGWREDRKNRVAEYPAIRKLIDRALVVPNVKSLEPAILRNGKIMALSQHTKRTLEQIAKNPIVSAVLPMPVDAAFWTPRPESRVIGRVGFCGRLSDPRKNIDLLLAAIARARIAMTEISAVLIGGEADSGIRARLAERGIADRVEFVPSGTPAEVRDHMRSFDLFVLPSHQEGLCIAALEAMASGCPVVSTRCGGPEEYVIDGETGILVGFDPDEMAAAMLKVLGDRMLHARLAKGARDRVLRDYSIASAESIFWGEFVECFPHLDRGRSAEPATSSGDGEFAAMIN